MRITLDEIDNDEQGVILYRGEPFTGTVVEVLNDGRVMSESDYYDGLPHGPEKVYRSDGQLEIERVYRYGMPVEIREWHRNGKLARLTRLEQGRKIEEHIWDENGVEAEV